MTKEQAEYVQMIYETFKVAESITKCPKCTKRSGPKFRKIGFFDKTIPYRFWQIYENWCLPCLQLEALLPSE